MDKPVLIIDLTDLSNESIIGIHDFLHALLKAFENHYIRQIRDHYRQLELDDDIDDIINDLF